MYRAFPRLLVATIALITVIQATPPRGSLAAPAPRPALSPICVSQPTGARVPGVILTGPRFQSVAVDETTRRAFVLVGGDYAPGNKHICTTSVMTIDASTGRLLFGTPIGPGTGPETGRSLAVDGPAHRLFAADADYVAPGHAPHPSVGVVSTLNGRLITSLHIGGNPGAIAIDVHTYRAFVAVSPNLPAPQGHVAMIAVTRGTVLRTIPLSVEDIVVDQRTNRVFLMTSGLVTTVEGTTGRVLRTAQLPTGYYHYNGAEVDERTGRLFVSQLGLAPPHSGSPNPPNSLSMLDSRTGALLKTILATPQLPLGNAIVDEPASRVLTWPNNTNATNASVLDASDGTLLRRVTLALPRGGFQGPTTVDSRNGDIYGYTYRGIRTIQPGRWSQSTVVSYQIDIIGQSLAVSGGTGVVFSVQWEGPSRYTASGFCTIHQECRAISGK